MDCSSLCDELIAKILVRLPPKPLFRAKCICKSWLKLISEQSFLNKFTRRLKSLPPLLTGFIYKKIDCEDWHLNFKDVIAGANFFDINNSSNNTEALVYQTSLSYLQWRGGGVLPVSAHNGLILCVEKPEQGELGKPLIFQYIIINPLTKQYVFLPKSHRYHMMYNTLLFCHDKEEEVVETKFMVFNLVYLYKKLKLIKVEIYSSEKRVWKKAKILYNSYDDPPIQVNCVLNGCVYLSSEAEVYVYNLTDESTRIVDLPPIEGIYYGSLGFSSGSVHYAKSNLTRFVVWTLVDDSKWSLKHNITFDSMIDECSRRIQSGDWFSPMAFHPLNHNLVLARKTIDPNRSVVLLRLDERKIELAENLCPNRWFRFIPYYMPAWLLP